MPKLVCIDSQVFIWGIKKKATEGQEHMIGRTEALLDSLDRDGKTIILPAPIITEILAPVDDESDAKHFLSEAQSRFRITPVDAPTAYLAGRIWNSKKDSWKDFYDESNDSLSIKRLFKYDILILASALHHQVDCFYTHDGPLRRLGIANGVKCEDVPNASVQSRLDA